MKSNGKKNFWQELKRAAPGRPILALAPMAGVTDSAFRQIAKSFGADVVYSEMVSATALAYDSAATLDLIRFDKSERPYVVQLFGSKPEHFTLAAKLITKEFRPDGLDINFGCPVKKVAKQGAGAVLMNKPKQSREIVRAVLDSTDLPVSIKIRSRAGLRHGEAGEVTALEFLDAMGGLPIAAVMIHGRPLAAGHAGPVDAEMIRRARNHFGGIILANGGVMSVPAGRELLEKSQADGLGIARGALGRPWLFAQLKGRAGAPKTAKEIFKIALKHARLVIGEKGEAGIPEFRKHLCWYVTGLASASTLRRELVKVNSLEEIKKILK